MSERLLGLPAGNSTGELAVVVLLFDPDEESNARDILTRVIASADGRRMEVLSGGRVLRVLVPLGVVGGNPPPSPLRLEPVDLGSLNTGVASHLQQLDDELGRADDQPTGYVVYVMWGPRATRSPARLDGYADFAGIGRPVQVEYVYLSSAPQHAHAPTPEPIDTVTVNAWQMVQTQSSAPGDAGSTHGTTSGHYGLRPLALAPRASRGQPPPVGVLPSGEPSTPTAPRPGPGTPGGHPLGTAQHGSPSPPSGHLIALPPWVIATAVGTALGIITMMTIGLVVLGTRKPAPPVVAPLVTTTATVTSSATVTASTTITVTATPTPTPSPTTASADAGTGSPTPSGSPRAGAVTYLADLDTTIGGWSSSGNISIDGTDYPQSLLNWVCDVSYQSPRTVEYNIGRDFKLFTAVVGMSDKTPSGSTSRVEFVVDGTRQPAAARNVAVGSASRVDLDVTNALTLAVVMSPTGDSKCGAGGPSLGTPTLSKG